MTAIRTDKPLKKAPEDEGKHLIRNSKNCLMKVATPQKHIRKSINSDDGDECSKPYSNN